MGVLDDAIREHIALKRQHGASEQDLVRQEQEALGPARRGVPAADASEEAAAAEVAEPEVAESEATELQATDEQPTEVVEAAPEPFSETDPFAEPDPLADPVPEGATGEGEEDVLEETPEFLQETPEHDRLWFEQKPPRDFDFDE